LKLKKFKYLIVGTFALILGHISYVFLGPYVFMGVAMKRLSNGWANTNQFTQGQQTTIHSRQIVRPSPDMAYAACVYDLRDGPVRIYAAPWDDYMSISVFAANSDNFFSQNDREAPQGVNIVLAKQGQNVPPGAKIVYSPSMRGIVLDRRLAPTKIRFELAKAARSSNVCSAI